MPLPSLLLVFAKLHLVLPGGPWENETWLSLTKSGRLQPEKDEDLPPGITRVQANSILAFLDVFRAQATEESRVAYVKSTNHPGRTLLADLIRKKWSRWGVINAVVEDLRAHNLLPLQEMVANESTTLPDSSSDLNFAFPDIGKTLFGDSVINDVGRLIPRYTFTISAIARHVYTRTKKQAVKTLERITVAENEIGILVDELTDAPTVEGVKRLIFLVAALKSDVEAVPVAQFSAIVEQAEQDIATIIGALGGLEEDEVSAAIKSGVAGTKPKARKASQIQAEQFHIVANEEEVAEILALFVQLHSVDTGEHFSPFALDYDDDEEEEEGGDLGVHVEADKSYGEMCSTLGLTENGLLHGLYNELRHIAGYTAWNDDYVELFIKGDSPMLKPIRLHWHQVAGLHATIRRILSSEPVEGPLAGVLIADEVGLGKTFLATTIAAWMIELRLIQNGELPRPLPPIAASLPYLGQNKVLPDLPTLILVPGTVLHQWLRELLVLLRRHGVDIFVLPNTKEGREAFWADDGPFHSSKHRRSNRIILAAQSALQSDYSLLYEPNKVCLKVRSPLEHPPKLPGFEKRVGKTLFSQQYLSVLLDEGQDFRNFGSKHSAARLILDQGLVRILITATPLQTRPEDIAAMARLVGIEYFWSAECWDSLQTYQSLLRRAKAEKAKGEYKGEPCPVRQLELAETTFLASKFENRVIRRKGTSVDNEGQQLVPLPPRTDITLIVSLPEHERRLIDVQAIPEEAIERVIQANTYEKTGHNFYTLPRLNNTFYRKKITDPIPTFSTLAEWNGVESTKLRTAREVVMHLLASDDAPEPYTENGVLHLPPLPELAPGEQHPQTRKILIYSEFRIFHRLIVNMFGFYNIPVLAIDGGMSYSHRDSVVEKFVKGTSARVLLFTKVGTVGLNLTCADTLIYLDLQWSKSQNDQAAGRIHRQGQVKPVTVLTVIAGGTIDHVVHNLAERKGAMADSFLGESKQEDFSGLLLGETSLRNLAEQEQDDDDDDYEEPASEAKSKKRSRSSKASAKETEGSRRRRRKISSAEFVEDEEDMDLSASGRDTDRSRCSSSASSRTSDSFVPFIPNPEPPQATSSLRGRGRGVGGGSPMEVDAQFGALGGVPSIPAARPSKATKDRTEVASISRGGVSTTSAPRAAATKATTSSSKKSIAKSNDSTTSTMPPPPTKETPVSSTTVNPRKSTTSAPSLPTKAVTAPSRNIPAKSSDSTTSTSHPTKSTTISSKSIEEPSESTTSVPRTKAYASSSTKSTAKPTESTTSAAPTKATAALITKSNPLTTSAPPRSTKANKSSSTKFTAKPNPLTTSVPPRPTEANASSSTKSTVKPAESTTSAPPTKATAASITKSNPLTTSAPPRSTKANKSSSTKSTAKSNPLTTSAPPTKATVTSIAKGNPLTTSAPRSTKANASSSATSTAKPVESTTSAPPRTEATTSSARADQSTTLKSTAKSTQSTTAVLPPTKAITASSKSTAILSEVTMPPLFKSTMIPKRLPLQPKPATPPRTSARRSLAEIAGGAGLLVTPHSTSGANTTNATVLRNREEHHSPLPPSSSPKYSSSSDDELPVATSQPSSPTEPVSASRPNDETSLLTPGRLGLEMKDREHNDAELAQLFHPTSSFIGSNPAPLLEGSPETRSDNDRPRKRQREYASSPSQSPESFKGCGEGNRESEEDEESSSEESFKGCGDDDRESEEDEESSSEESFKGCGEGDRESEDDEESSSEGSFKGCGEGDRESEDDEESSSEDSPKGSGEDEEESEDDEESSSEESPKGSGEDEEESEDDEESRSDESSKGRRGDEEESKDDEESSSDESSKGRREDDGEPVDDSGETFEGHDTSIFEPNEEDRQVEPNDENRQTSLEPNDEDGQVSREPSAEDSEESSDEGSFPPVKLTWDATPMFWSSLDDLLNNEDGEPLVQDNEDALVQDNEDGEPLVQDNEDGESLVQDNEDGESLVQDNDDQSIEGAKAPSQPNPSPGVTTQVRNHRFGITTTHALPSISSKPPHTSLTNNDRSATFWNDTTVTVEKDLENTFAKDLLERRKSSKTTRPLPLTTSVSQGDARPSQSEEPPASSSIPSTSTQAGDSAPSKKALLMLNYLKNREVPHVHTSPRKAIRNTSNPFSKKGSNNGQS